MCCLCQHVSGPGPLFISMALRCDVTVCIRMHDYVCMTTYARLAGARRNCGNLYLGEWGPVLYRERPPRYTSRPHPLVGWWGGGSSRPNFYFFLRNINVDKSASLSYPPINLKEPRMTVARVRIRKVSIKRPRTTDPLRVITKVCENGRWEEAIFTRFAGKDLRPWRMQPIGSYGRSA